MSLSSGEAQAIRRVAPAPAASGLANRAFRFTAALDGSTEWEVPVSPGTGCWVTIANIGPAATDILYFCAYSSGKFPSGFLAVSSTDLAISPGATVDYWLDPGVDRIKFASASTPTAIASCHRSSL